VFKRSLVVLGILVCAASLGARAQAGVIRDQYVVVLRAGADRSAAVGYAQSLGGTVLMQYKSALNGYAAQLPSTALAAVKADSRVRFVSANQTATLSAQTLPTGVDRIDGDLSSARSGDGAALFPSTSPSSIRGSISITPT
jgi:subtilisin